MNNNESTLTPGQLAPAMPEGRESLSLGARMFEARGWIHPVLLVTAIILGLTVGAAQRDAMIVGGALLGVHLFGRLWSARHIRGAARVHARKAQEKKVLVTGGPFGLVRNPLYVANTAGIVGACLLFGPAWFGAVAAVASMVWYHYVVRWEESILIKLYADDYPEYCRLVPRFIPRFSRPAGLPRPDTREDYPWLKVLRRERGTIGLELLIVGLAVLRATLL